MTKLSQYLSDTGTTQADLSKRVGIKASHMSLLASGDRLPSLPLAILIERETDGAVPASCWVREDLQRGVA